TELGELRGLALRREVRARRGELGVEPAELEVGCGDVADQTDERRAPLRLRRLEIGLGRLDRPRPAAAEVHLPERVDAGAEEIAVAVAAAPSSATAVAGEVVRAAIARRFAALGPRVAGRGVGRRPGAGARQPGERARLPDAALGDGEIDV